MSVALRKDHCIARNKMNRCLPHHLDIALAFGDHVKNHHPLGPWFQKRRSIVSMR
jgi:hypothetical protein